MTLPVATSFKKSSNVCIGLELWAGFVNKNKCMYLCRKIYSSDVCLFACFLRNSNKLTKKKTDNKMEMFAKSSRLFSFPFKQ